MIKKSGAIGTLATPSTNCFVVLGKLFGKSFKDSIKSMIVFFIYA